MVLKWRVQYHVKSKYMQRDVFVRPMMAGASQSSSPWTNIEKCYTIHIKTKLFQQGFVTWKWQKFPMRKHPSLKYLSNNTCTVMIKQFCFSKLSFLRLSHGGKYMGNRMHVPLI